MSENRFTKELRKLNTAQRQAVETIEGPVMVVAGPGTGKTQVVALRIAAILQSTQLSAKNILALTFTEAGVVALRERLSKYIGAVSYQVTIATFHGFANEVIGTFPHIFSTARTLTQLDDLERLLLLEKIIKKNPLVKLLRPLRSQTAHVRDIASAIRTAKQEAIEVNQIVTYVQALGRKEVKNKTEAERNKRTSQILLEFAEILTEYQKELERRSVYDYEDMILLVLSALQENAEVKAYFQERYQYILVDEYQDTNNAQNKLVELLADFFETPNLFVVGDDKQAIYRFQGASVTNMLHFYRRYPDLTVISLTQNYRSSPEILETAHELISHNSQQLSKQIPAVADSLLATVSPGLQPDILVATTQIAEHLALIDRLNRLHKDGIAWEEMAVLFRTNSEANDFRDSAEKAGLVVAGLQSTDLLKEREVQVLVQLLRAINDPNNDVAVASALRALVGTKEALSVVEVINTARETKKKIIAAALETANQGIKNVAERLVEWHHRQELLSVPELVEEVLYRGGVLDAIRKRPQHLSSLELVATLIENCREYAKRNQTAQLADWLEYLELHRTYGLSFSVNRSRAETAGVFINTVHQAKGLEFDVVFIPHATDRVWRVKPNRSTVKIPSELIGAAGTDNDELEDMRRLFYVAITRARKQLTISYSQIGADGRDELPSQLVKEIETTARSEPLTIKETQLSRFITQQLSPTPDSLINSAELSFIRERVAQAPFSFTAYWDYKTCPRTYLLKHVYKLPTPFTPSLAYGDSVHAALERFNRDYKAFKKLPTKQKLLLYFREEIQRSIPYTNRDTFLEQGIDVLSEFYDSHAPTWIRPLGTEYSFRPHQVMLEKIWLNGKIDCIEPISPTTKNVRIIDYKTGSQSRTANYIEGKTQDSDGKMKAQLVFYAMLCELDPLFPYQAKEFAIQFIDDKKTFRCEVFQIAADEIKQMKRDVVDSYNEILSRKDFPIGDEESEIVQLFQQLT
jgi:DNA helicase II / ATP-dependent DNA helicase PcrA